MGLTNSLLTIRQSHRLPASVDFLKALGGDWAYW